MNLNSKYSELEICNYITNNMKYKDLKELVLNNASLRIKYGAFDKKNFNYERTKAIDTVILLSKTNKLLRESIIEIAENESIDMYGEHNKIESIEDAKKYINKTSNTKDMFLLAIMLWKNLSSELNAYGDEIFKNCLLNKNISKEEIEKSKMSDNSKILSMNLAEFIEQINNYDTKINEYEEKLKAKDEIIKELREQLKINGDPKELKKEINKLGKEIQKSNSDIKEQNNNTNKLIDTLKNNLIDIKKDVNKQNVTINSNTKVLIKELTKTIKDIQNTIISSIVDDNRKLNKGINETIGKQLDTIIENTLKENISVKLEQEVIKQNNTDINTELTGVQEFPSELDELLGELL